MLAGVEVGIEAVHALIADAAEVAASPPALHSSNRVVAQWLRELGCRVRGTALLSRWRVEPAAAPRSATIPAARHGDLPPPEP